MCPWAPVVPIIEIRGWGPLKGLIRPFKGLIRPALPPPYTPPRGDGAIAGALGRF